MHTRNFSISLYSHSAHSEKTGQGQNYDFFLWIGYALGIGIGTVHTIIQYIVICRSHFEHDFICFARTALARK